MKMMDIGRKPPNRKIKRASSLVWLCVVSSATFALMPTSIAKEPPSPTVITSAVWAKHPDVLRMNTKAYRKPAPKVWHPPHQVKVWTTVHKGRTFRVTQLPRCEHLETIISYNPSGETLARAKNRLNGIAACTGSFHHPQSMAIADFFQKEGAVYCGARTGRSFIAVHTDGKVNISRNYAEIKGKPGVSALALGQSLVPLTMDGFSKAFMNRKTDRMAIGTNNNFLFIVQGKSDIWRLAHFMNHKLPVTSAINSDGGHVVRGKAPVHIVFRWNTNRPVMLAGPPAASDKTGGI